MKTVLTEGFEKDQIAQIMKALALGSEYIYKDYNKIAKNSDWIIFVDAATCIKNFVDEWYGWMDEIIEEAMHLNRVTDPDKRRILVKQFINSTTLTLFSNWEGYS